MPRTAARSSAGRDAMSDHARRYGSRIAGRTSGLARPRYTARSMKGEPIAVSDQSKTRSPSSVCAMFQGWRSPCSTESGSPIVWSSPHADCRRSRVSGQTRRVAGSSRSPSPSASSNPGRSSESWVSGRSAAPAASRSPVRPSQARWIRAKRARPSGQADSGALPSSRPPRSSMRSQPSCGSISMTRGIQSGVALASALVVRASAANNGMDAFVKSCPPSNGVRSTTASGPW